VELVGEHGATLARNLDALREHARAAAVSEARTRRIVYAGAALYAFFFVAAAAVFYYAFRGARLDMGDMVQAVWSTAHGHFLQDTSALGREGIRLGGHVDPFLVLFVPLWRVWPSPLMLLVVQAIAVAAGALPVYWLARKHLQSDRAAAHFAFAYLLFPATQWNALTIAAGPHPVSFAVPLILFAIWFLDEERLAPFALFALLAASTKEEIPVAIGCLGIWYALRKSHRIAGTAIFALGLAASVVNFLVIIPHFAPAGINPFADRYTRVGGTPKGIAHKAVTDPLALVHAVATGHKLLYLVLMLVPFLGLWLREPLLFLGAVPDLLINLLSSKPEQTTFQFQYTAGIVPFLVAASILGAARLRRDPNRVSFYALAGASCIALFSPVVFAASDLPAALPSNAVHAAKVHALDMIPSSVPVAASSELAGYLSERRYIYVFPYVRAARWVILDAEDKTVGDQKGYRRTIREIDRSPRWKVVFQSHGVQVLRRRPIS
jgi:uncharacterized membrane protein